LTTAFVLINTELGYETDIRTTLKEIPEVKEVYMVFGVYDIVARIKAGSMDKLKELIGTKIRLLEKVRSTLTMIVV
jgi:DNA-binding Lrp family transcriptional regulator